MNYFRPAVEALSGYVPGEQPQERRFIKLNTNENPYPPSPKVVEAIRRAAGDRLRTYPDPLATEFRNAAGKVLGVPPEWIVACNGSDDALTMLIRACLDAGDTVAVPSPSYTLYEVLAKIQGCGYREHPFTDDWRLPADFADEARLCLIPNPNSPSGTSLPPEELLALAQSASCLVVADEAYADFADESCVPLTAECDRLVVTRSLSKSYGLAGLRFGFVVAQPVVIEALCKVKDSYNCDALALAGATAALEDQQFVRQTISKIRTTRQRLRLSLLELGFDVSASHANFVWARKSAPVEPIYRTLKERGILVRYLTYPSYGEGLRISVGTDDETDQLLDELRQIV